MPFHSVDDQVFWDTAPESMRFAQDAIKEVLKTDIAVLPIGDGSGLEDPENLSGPVVVLVRFPPHTWVPSHGHTTHRIELVLRGEMHVGDRVCRPGDIMTSAPQEIYGPLRTGAEGCITVEIFGDASGFLGGIVPGDTSEEAMALLAQLRAKLPTFAAGNRDLVR